MNEIPDVCSNCDCDLEYNYRTCHICGEPLCDTCICLCGIDAESKLVEKAFEIEDDEGLITNLDSLEKTRYNKDIEKEEDKWIEIHNFPTKEDEEDF